MLGPNRAVAGQLKAHRKQRVGFSVRTIFASCHPRAHPSEETEQVSSIPFKTEGWF